MSAAELPLELERMLSGASEHARTALDVWYAARPAGAPLSAEDLDAARTLIANVQEEYRAQVAEKRKRRDRKNRRELRTNAAAQVAVVAEATTGLGRWWRDYGRLFGWGGIIGVGIWGARQLLRAWRGDGTPPGGR